MSFFKWFPYRRHYSNNNDLEAGGSQSDVLEESFSSNASRQLQIRKRLARDNSTRAANLFKVRGKERANGTLETSSSFHLPVVILQLDRTSLLYCQGITMLRHCRSVEGSKDYWIR